MKYKIDFKTDYVEIITSGKFDLADYKSMIEETTDNESWQEGMRVVYDARNVDFECLEKYGTLARFGEITSQFKERLCQIKVAAVFSDRKLLIRIDLQKAIREKHGCSFPSELFTNYDLALKWLRSK